MYSIFVVAPVQVYIDGISALFVSRGRFEVAGSGTSIVGSVDTEASAVVADFSAMLPSTLTQYLASTMRRAPVIAFGVPDDHGAALNLLEMGVTAYVGENSSADELYDTVLGAIERGADIAPGMVPVILERLRQRPSGNLARTSKRLTRRELRVAELMGAHMSNKEIASTLGISVHTVKIHVHHVIQKLALCRRSEVRDAIGARPAHPRIEPERAHA